MKRLMLFFVFAFILLTVGLAGAVDFWGGGPEPGDIYKEFIFNNNNNNWRVTDPNMDLTRHPEAAAFLPNPKLTISNVDLAGAIFAELVIDFWGGHDGTTNKRFRFNNNSWIVIPELDTLGPCPSPGNKYMQQVNHLISIPLNHLKSGNNILEGTSGPNPWDWGQWGWFGVVLRVYYNSGKSHPTGQITSPGSGATISDNPSIAVSTSAGVNRVDVLAFNNGYDTDGDGNYPDIQRNYHRQSKSDQLAVRNHVGTDTSAPFSVQWDTQWVPDQAAGQVKFLARIRDNSGCWYVTDEVSNITLKRTNFSVKLYKSTGVPQKFWVRAGRTMSSSINIPTLSTATAALMHVATWNGNDDSNDFWSKINSWKAPKYGQNHFYHYDQISVPLSALKAGTNTVSFYSSTTHHGIEIMWPGPAIAVRYGSAPAGSPPSITQQPSDVTVSTGQTASFSVSATGTAPLSYQWRKNGSNISGATGSSYTTAAVTSADDGDRYSCSVSNSYGNVTSSSATLSVSSGGTAPTITQHPASATVQAGQTATFSVSATGTAPLSYQWRKNGNNISGATGSSYTTPAVSESDSGAAYQCRVSNAYGTVTSNAATLTVSSTPPPPPPPTGNVAQNPGFEEGKSPWKFFTSGSGSFAVTGPGHDSSNAARLTINEAASNIQLFQYGLSLEPNTEYRLTFSAYSNTGHDMKVSLLKHVSPYTNYGLLKKPVNLTSSWSTYSLTFTTPNFGGTVNDGRLMFWFASSAAAGDQYGIDNVSLTTGGSPPPPPPPPPTGNVAQNPGFEEGKSPWKFYTNAIGSFTVAGPGDGSANAAVVTTTTVGTNIQLYQYNIPLEPNTDYQLKFSAYSNTGHNFRVSLAKHVAPYTNYGLNRAIADLATGWQSYTFNFTTKNFSNPVSDARLIFWFASDAAPGDQYRIDNVSLTKN